MLNYGWYAVPESFKVLIKELQSLGLDIKLYSETDEEIEIKEHTEEGMDGIEERVDESELESENLTEVNEEVEEQDEEDGDEFYTNILDEDEKYFIDSLILILDSHELHDNEKVKMIRKSEEICFFYIIYEV